MATTTCELLWLLTLLSNFGICHTNSAQLFCDRQTTLLVAANLVFHERSKHIELDCYFTCDKIQDDTIKTFHFTSLHQLAHILKSP